MKSFDRWHCWALCVVCLAFTAVVHASERRFGVLLMAHGGTPEWDADVTSMAQQLQHRFPVAVAFGMADAASLAVAVTELEQAGVTDVGVVRLFISGESWHDRTRQILGLDPGAPPRAALDPHAGHGAGHRMEFWRIDSPLRFAVSVDGLADAAETEAILLQRAQALSQDPATEEVLVIAHGTDDDAIDDTWRQTIDRRAERLRREGGFHRVSVMTLREDWRDKRDVAEDEIRARVIAANAAGHATLVIPFRVQGFGPYAEVLGDLPYRADHTGLLPHPAVADWVARQAERLRGELLP